MIFKSLPKGSAPGQIKKNKQGAAHRLGSKRSHRFATEKSFGKLNNKDIFTRGGMDIPLFALTIIILAIGLVMLFPLHIPILILNTIIHINFFLSSSYLPLWE